MKMIDTDDALIRVGDAKIAIEESWWMDSKEGVIERIDKLPWYIPGNHDTWNRVQKLPLLAAPGRRNGKSFTTVTQIIDDIATKYMENDIVAVKRFYYDNKEYLIKTDPFAIKQVIFNDPATIVLWEDGTKTVVKCQEGDKYDKEKGLTMCITKKLFGNKGNYYNAIRKWVKE